MFHSEAGLIGAMLGCVVGAIQYLLFVGLIEKALRATEKVGSPEEHDLFEHKLSVMRRLILGLDIAVFAAAGYVIGASLFG
jgi:hypothetical protein